MPNLLRETAHRQTDRPDHITSALAELTKLFKNMKIGLFGEKLTIFRKPYELDHL